MPKRTRKRKPRSSKSKDKMVRNLGMYLLDGQWIELILDRTRDDSECVWPRYDPLRKHSVMTLGLNGAKTWRSWVFRLLHETEEYVAANMGLRLIRTGPFGQDYDRNNHVSFFMTHAEWESVQERAADFIGACMNDVRVVFEEVLYGRNSKKG